MSFNQTPISSSGHDSPRIPSSISEKATQKILKKEKRIHFLMDHLSHSPSPAKARQFRIQLSKETRKLSHLIHNNQQIPEIERVKATECLMNARECLEQDTLFPSVDEIESRPAWLRDDVEVTSNLLAHLVGDTFAKAADLEGGSHKESLEFALACLEESPEFLEEKDWKFLSEQLTGALEAQDIFVSVLRGGVDLLPSAVKELKTFVKNSLSKNQELLIPGGWAGAPSGHAMYYKIVPQVNGKYTFQIYNRGSGAEYHAYTEQKFKHLYQAFIEIADVDKEKLLDPYFLRAMIEQQCFKENPCSYATRDTKYQKEDIYESLLQMLGGRRTQRNVELEDLMSTQRSGTCSWKSLTAVFRNVLGYLPSKQLKLRMEVQAIWSYYQKNRENLAKQPFSRNVLEQAVASVGRTLQTTKDYISEEEYTQLIALLASMQQSVQIARSQSLQDQARSAPSTLTAGKPLNFPSSFSQNFGLYTSPLNIYTPSDTITVRSLTSFDINSVLEEWKPTPENLLKDLSQFNALCNQAHLDQQFLGTNTLFLQVMRHLPVPTSDLSTEAGRFWKKAITEHADHINELMSTVAQFAEHYYVSCFYIEGSPSCPPARTHAVIKALHIQNILKEHSSLTEIGLEMPAEFAYLEQIFSQKKFREMGFRSNDPLVSKELACIYQDLQQKAAPFRRTETIVEEFLNSKQKIEGLSGLAFGWMRGLGPCRQEFDENTATNSFFRTQDLNPEFAFIQKKLSEDRQFFDAAAELYEQEREKSPSLLKSFDELNTCVQIAFVYTCQELLPPLFIQWRSQVLQSNQLLYGPFAPPITSVMKNPDDLFPSLSFLDGSFFSDENKTVQVYYSIPLILKKISTDYPKKNLSKEDLSTNDSLSDRYLSNLRPFKASALKEIVKTWQNNRQLTQNEVYSQEFPEIVMPLQQKRELLTLGTNKDLQIEQTIAYFSKNIHLLADRDYQTLFHILFFEEDFLLKEFKNCPEVIVHLENFIRDGYQLAYEAADIETCVFYINLSRHLQSFERSVFPEKKDKTSFIPVQKSLNQLFSLTGLTDLDKSLLYSELLASHHSLETIGEKEAVSIVRASTYLSMHPVPSKISRPDVLQEQQEVVSQFYFLIQRMVNDSHNLLNEALSPIINEALSPIIEDYKPGSWRAITSSIFESSEGYVLNLITGDFFEKDQPKTTLPGDILDHPEYQRLFNQNYPAKCIHFNTYEFSDSRGDKYRVIKELGKEIHIHREIEGEWHELKPAWAPELLFNAGIATTYFCWQTCNTPTRFEFYDAQGLRKAYAVLQRKGYTVLKEKEQVSSEHTVTLRFQRYPDRIFDQELSWINSSEFSNSSLGFLTNFEDPGYINVWQNPQGIPCLIELPRYQLTFQLDMKNPKQPLWVCPSLSGFHLAASQHAPRMEELEGYLVLENKKGEQQVILPLQELDKKKSSINPVFSEKIALKRTFDVDDQRYASYQLKSKGAGELVIEPSNAEAAFYLAYRKLAIGRYNEARYLLSLHRLPLRGDCSKELNWLRQIISIEGVNNDNTGQGAALRLHAVYLYLELLQRTGEQEVDPTIWKKIAKTAKLYVNQVSKIGTLQLPLDEERLVFRTLLNQMTESNGISVFLINYLKAIDPEFSKENVETLLTKAADFFMDAPLLQNNRGQKKVFKAANRACQKPPKEWEEGWTWCMNFAEMFSQNNQEASFLYTRPGEEGIRSLLIRSMKTPAGAEKKALLKEIRCCLALSTYDNLRSGHIGRAVLEMISRHPEKYRFTPVPDLKELHYENKKEEVMEKWLTENFVPILKDYVREVGDPGQTFISRPSLKIKPSKKHSLRPQNLPVHSSGYVAVSGSITHRKKETFTIKPEESAFHSADFLVPLPEEQVTKRFEENEKMLDKTAAKAATLFSVEGVSNRCIANEFTRLRNDCKAFVISSKKEASEAVKQEVPVEKLPELHEKLDLEIQSLKLSLIERERALLLLANPPIEVSNFAEASAVAPFLSGERQRIGMDRLILLHGRRQLDKLLEPPTACAPEDIAILKEQISQYLEQATLIQQLQRGLNSVEKCLKQIKKTGKVDPDESEKLAKELLATRQFKVEEHPEWIVLEYWADILIRVDQRDKLYAFFEDGQIEAIHQMIMGAGKTSTLMPLLALFLADGKHLLTLMLPEELLESVFEELKLKLGEGFMQMIFHFDYGRSSDYSVEGLKALKTKLLAIEKNGECLMASPKSFHCFYLKFIETWRAMSKAQGKEYGELSEVFELMREILNIFRNRGTVLMDEVDLILSCRDEVNFPVGALASIKERDMDVLLEIYDILLDSEALKSHIKTEFDPNQAEQAPPFNPETYHETLKPILAKELLERLNDPQLMIGDQEITSQLQKTFKTVNQETLIAFLCHDPEHFDEAYDYVKSLDRNTRNVLHLAHEELNTLLPFGLQKDSDEDYGVRTQVFATPLKRGKPLFTVEKGKNIEKTRYADPFEAANYTFQSYYKTGIPQDLVDKQIKALQLQAIEDLKKGMSLKDSPAHQDFCVLSGGSERFHLLKVSEQNLKEITDHVNSNNSLRRLFLKRYVFSTIHFHTRRLNSDAQTLACLFNRCYGFSGTTWNAKTYHDKLTTVPSMGTDAKTIFALLGSAGVDYEIENVHFKTPFEFIKTLTFEERELALIDNGAYLKGESILEEAKMLLSEIQAKNPAIKGVVFFDDDNKKVILEIGSDKPIPLKNSKLKPEQRFTIYTKPFTTGADIAQAPKAVAYFTVGRNLLLRDYLQGVFRMRKVDQTQKIRLFVNDNVQKVINSTLNRNPETPISREDVIVFAAYNQAKQIGDDNYVAIKQKMLAVIKEAILEILLDDKIPPDLIAGLYTEAMEELFAPSTGEEPCELYAGKERQADADSVLDKDVMRYVRLLNKVLESSSFLQEHLQEKALKAAIEEKKQVDLVPQQITSREQDNSNQLVQVQQEQQTQVQTMQQTQSMITAEAIKQWRHFTWPDGNIYDTDFYQPGWAMTPADWQWTTKLIGEGVPSSVQSLVNWTANVSKKSWNWTVNASEKALSYLPQKVKNKAVALGESMISTTWENLQSPPWTYPLKDFLSQNPTLHPLLSLFDDEALKVSFNFAPKIAFAKEDRLAVPFDSHQKPIQHVLIAHHEANNTWEVTLMDQLEAADFKQRLADSTKKGYKNPTFRELSLCLQDIHLTTTQTAKFSPTPEELKSKEVLSLLVKIKFLNGEADYNEQEKALLKDWLSTNKWHEVKNIYRDVILAQHSHPDRVLENIEGILTL